MIKKIFFDMSYLSYRPTPWDTKALLVNTNEIIRIDYKEENHIEILLSKLEQSITKGLVYFRLDSNEQILKKYLLKNNYYIVESSLELINTQVQKKDFTKIYKSNIELSQHITQKNILEIKQIAKTAFKYSRFHEDPFFDTKLCCKRYENWIDDLIRQNKEILVYKNKDDEVISFMFFSIKDNKVELVLGGSHQDYGLITPAFFSAVMQHLQNMGITKIVVIISFSNITIFNIYIQLGFIIKKTMFDYHKKIQKDKNERKNRYPD